MSTIGLTLGRHETISEAPTELGGGPSSGQQVLTVLGAFVKFIPAEIVAAYGAFVGANWSQQNHGGHPPSPSTTIWLASLIACPLLVLLAAWLGGKWDKWGWKLLFAPLGFVIWSASIPHSIWERWSSFKDSPETWVGLVLVIGGGAIAAIGQKLIGDQ